jgi:hypothetical protein
MIDGMREMLCSGVGAYLVCIPVNGVRLDINGVKLPAEYVDWTVEKVVYSPVDDRLYVQVARKNLRKILTL